MQQFTVPQFIDVESKIIGPITTRQFLIILGAGLIIALSWRIFDFSLFVIITVAVAIIAVLFAFVKVNGRPFHYFIVNAVQTLRRSRVRVWNNSVLAQMEDIKIETPIKLESRPVVKARYQKSRLAEVALVVDTKGKYKGE